jgi:hypothetical protein
MVTFSLPLSLSFLSLSPPCVCCVVRNVLTSATSRTPHGCGLCV